MGFTSNTARPAIATTPMMSEQHVPQHDLYHRKREQTIIQLRHDRRIERLPRRSQRIAFVWIVAALMTVSGSSNSSSSSVCFLPLAAAYQSGVVAERHTPVCKTLDYPAMFVPMPTTTAKNRIFVSDSTTPKTSRNHNHPTEAAKAFARVAPRNRGVLGIYHEDESPENTSRSTRSSLTMEPATRSSSSTAFSSSRSPSLISHVDSSAWNSQEPLELDAQQAYGRAASTSTTAPSRRLTDKYIDSLTVVQLKQELGTRQLKKSGVKAELQARLRAWALEEQKKQQQQQQQQQRSTNHHHRRPLEHEWESWNIGSSPLLESTSSSRSAASKRKSETTSPSTGSSDDNATNNKNNNDGPNSLAEWARTVDLEPLLHRREVIHREKLHGKPDPSRHRRTKGPSSRRSSSSSVVTDYRSVLKQVFDKPSSRYSNREVKQMYAAAKLADQAGDRTASKQLLTELQAATPHDARIYRRLARLETEDGDFDAARAVLRQGLDLHPDNAYLWHGLGHLEGLAGHTHLQQQHLRQAILVDPTVPHSHHALGLLEHTLGHVAVAMQVLSDGVDYCPTNHRLHHALGDLYRDAKLLDQASRSYEKALLHGPFASHAFGTAALANVAYEQGNIQTCRRWLHKAVQLHQGRHANGWVALAQMEEAEGNVEAARSACLAGIGQYERGLVERSRSVQQRRQTQHRRPSAAAAAEAVTTQLEQDPETLQKSLLPRVPAYRSGDRFFNVYRTWARLEERYGTLDSVEDVYQRANAAFPQDYRLALDAARYHSRTLRWPDRARHWYAQACARSRRHAEPYRLFAEFEMAQGNFVEARKILYSGAMAVPSSLSSRDDRRRPDTAALFLTWAVCEWHVGKLNHAERLLDHVLDLTAPLSPTSSSAMSTSNSTTATTSNTATPSPSLRAYALYVRARFEYATGQLRRAQHYVGLSLACPVAMPGGHGMVWNLWAAISHDMGDDRMASKCQDEAARWHQAANERIANETNGSGSAVLALQPTDVQPLMRRSPWHLKLFGNSRKERFLDVDLLPKKETTQATWNQS